MFRLKSPSIFASEIADFLNVELHGPNVLVSHPRAVADLCAHSLTYVDDDTELASPPPGVSAVLVFCRRLVPLPDGWACICVDQPGPAFFQAVNELFVEIDVVRISPLATVHPEARIGDNVAVGDHSVIGPDVVVGANTQILSNVVISGRVEIGRDCIVKSNTTVGSEGYTFQTEEMGRPVHYPHLGSIRVGDHVWIGANSSIETPALRDTVIADSAKIDDLVHIGGGSRVGEAAMVTAGVVLSRNVTVCPKAVIAPNAVVVEGRTVGPRATVGAGAVVVRDLDGDAVYVGNPARLLRRKEGDG